MAVKKNKEDNSEERQYSTLTKDILKRVDHISIENELRESYLTYAMSVIVSRALPDVRDGLKPVHRRILYAMYDANLTHDKPYKKSAATVGEVLARYHPHGDAAVYGTMVRMAQDFSMRYLLVDGQGNFGSIDDDPPAAMRYTEARMTRFAEEMLNDIEKETVKFVPNFDDSRTEPSVLPATVPQLLVNGSMGIAIGMATNMPPHNLKEVVNAIVYYIDHQDAEIKDLMRYVQGPDFPTAGIIYGKEGIKEAYTTGKGRIKLRARLEVEETKRDREAIVVKELPYGVVKTTLHEKIADLVKQGKIEGVADIRDESSNRAGIRLIIELKKGVATQIVLNQLWKHTDLETTFGIINLALVNGEPKVLNLKELIKYFVDHRVEVITKRTEYDLNQAKAKAHILEGLLIAQANIEEVIRIIRESENTDAARTTLMNRFKLSEKQAQAILDMPLKRLTALEKLKIEQELQQLREFIAYCEDLLAHPEKILAVIKDELKKISEKYGDDRRSEIIGKTNDTEIDEEDLIHDEDVAVSITTQGFIKRVPASSYRTQGRGGVGVQGGKSQGEHYIEHLFVASTKDYLFIFTDRGKAFWMKVHEIPALSKISQGKSIKFILNLAPEEKITSYFTVSEFDPKQSIIMVTKMGTIKKMELKHLENAKKRGILALTLENNDELVAVSPVQTGDDFIMTTAAGLALRITEEKIRKMGRAAAGVKGISLDDDDICVSGNAIHKGESLIVITENGIGKRLSSKQFNVKGRGGKGQIYIKPDNKTGNVVSVKTVGDKDEIMVVTTDDMTIKIKADSIPELGRNAKGVKIVNISDGARVSDLAVVPADNEEKK
ncbi:DNA gyrase subunit A [Brachyspira hyodysenteriae]|uniref:DNA gyrase subunit A n=2 Tax=Brachyspira hyodysenteriae TaxID=159 RepID=GYRA_BRAHW|nr:DNA gyrase subunit A [Brachyspira hyodysenteriae]C0R046.1 RecName: Full=DNA gyrase subunit A [Brachyspira hyodysenteriae WA1]ACN83484.1 DNA gyrase subunit A [Brachyspira hyodysenteriae WA1]ANN64381.1 DNA gyrase subunit A [Brachyspira hyodysenteriae ATCC 27164]KLI14268.1 DNA gyrase subunit A [Brachyspira hyodysenteriae]KLI17075.1 DNA gyrase subunit A [Brachyspira hyodysenteriae]KLI18339.1 DNA gyrase subunit A [Brachyspira hyodysenteriae]